MADVPESWVARATERVLAVMLDMAEQVWEQISGLLDLFGRRLPVQWDTVTPPSLEDFHARITAVVEPEIAAAFDAGAAVVALTDVMGTEETRRIEYMAQARDRLARGRWPVNAWDAVRATLTVAVEEGWTREETAGQVLALLGPDATVWQAERIVVTELHAAYNAGTYYQGLAEAELVGALPELEWIATPDERTRIPHWDADGQRVMAGTPFQVGGEALRFPGDPMGSASNIINCRCGLGVWHQAPARDPVAAAAGVAELPFAERGASWDGRAAEAAALACATRADGSVDPGVLGRIYLYRLPDTDGTAQAHYRFPVARPKPGGCSLEVVWAGVTAAAGRLHQAHIGADGRARVARALAALYRRAAEVFDDDTITPPESLTADAWLRPDIWEGARIRLDFPTFSVVETFTADTVTLTYPSGDAYTYELDDVRGDWDSGITFAWTDDGDGRVEQYMELGNQVTIYEEPAEGPDALHEGTYETVTAAAGGGEATEATDGGCACGQTPESVAAVRRAAVRALTAATGEGEWTPPAEWFQPYDGPATGIRVTSEGRVLGYLATWEREGQQNCHVGLKSSCEPPPRSADGLYRYFHQDGTPLTLDDGTQVHPGLLTMDIGHGDQSRSQAARVAHYDNPLAQAAVVVAGEDDIGIWVAGSVLPAVLADRDRMIRLQRSRFSGHWEPIGGGMELIAATAVNAPGFPNPSRTGFRLTASAVADEVLRRLDVARREERVEQLARVAARTRRSRVSALAASAFRTRRERAAALAAVALPLTAADNWVEQQGGLPDYIKEVSDALQREGMSQSRAIATAVNRIRGWCRGDGDVTARTKTRACAAIAQWERMRAQSGGGS